MQKLACLDPNAPAPSIETILHAVIPYVFVDHTHADAVCAVTNSPDGEAFIREIYGDKALIVPYCMPGFVLAKEVKKLTVGVDWEKIEVIILLNHGIFTWGNDAKTSYKRMVEMVNRAEEFLRTKKAYFESLESGHEAREKFDPVPCDPARSAHRWHRARSAATARRPPTAALAACLPSRSSSPRPLPSRAPPASSHSPPGALTAARPAGPGQVAFAELRKAVSATAGVPMILRANNSYSAKHFASLPDVVKVAGQVRRRRRRRRRRAQGTRGRRQRCAGEPPSEVRGGNAVRGARGKRRQRCAGETLTP